jgi:tetratricopeptide (TPR) repeat protein
LLADDPTNTQVLTAVASGYQRIGTILRGGATWQKKPGDFHTALENFNKSLAIYKDLMAGEPNNSRHRRNAADIMAMSLPVQASLGDKAGVMEGYQTAMAIFEKLAARDPKNAEARLDIAFTHQYMCQSLLQLNSLDDALKSCRKAIEASKSLLAMDPTNAEVSNLVYLSYMSMAEVLKEEGDLAGEFKLYKQLLGVAEQWPDVELQSGFGLDYIHRTSTKLGRRYAELAADAKISAKKKRDHWQAARHWLRRSLEALHDLQKRDGLKRNYTDSIKVIEKEIADCDAALE